MTTQAESGDDAASNQEPAGVPHLDEVAGTWVDAADLAHLPSLRNQWGQGHVNADLSSMSWLAQGISIQPRRYLRIFSR